MENNDELQKDFFLFLALPGLALLFPSIVGGGLLRKPMKSPLNGVEEIPLAQNRNL